MTQKNCNTYSKKDRLVFLMQKKRFNHKRKNAQKIIKNDLFHYFFLVTEHVNVKPVFNFYKINLLLILITFRFNPM